MWQLHFQLRYELNGLSNQLTDGMWGQLRLNFDTQSFDQLSSQITKNFKSCETNKEH